jgi:hypothetical protein
MTRAARVSSHRSSWRGSRSCSRGVWMSRPNTGHTSASQSNPDSSFPPGSGDGRNQRHARARAGLTGPAARIPPAPQRSRTTWRQFLRAGRHDAGLLMDLGERAACPACACP